MMNFSEPNEKLAAALAFFQSKIENVETGSVGQDGNRRFKYANLGDIMDVIRGPLAAAKLVVVQPVWIDRESGGHYLTTRVMHETGQYVESTMGLPDSGNLKDFGKSITYTRRYALAAMLGIAYREEDPDDDGSASQIRREVPEPRRAAPPRQNGNGPPRRDPVEATAKSGDWTPAKVVLTKKAAADRALKLGLDGADGEIIIRDYLSERGIDHGGIAIDEAIRSLGGDEFGSLRSHIDAWNPSGRAAEDFNADLEGEWA